MSNVEIGDTGFIKAQIIQGPNPKTGLLVCHQLGDSGRALPRGLLVSHAQQLQEFISAMTDDTRLSMGYPFYVEPWNFFLLNEE